MPMACHASRKGHLGALHSIRNDSDGSVRSNNSRIIDSFAQFICASVWAHIQFTISSVMHAANFHAAPQMKRFSVHLLHGRIEFVPLGLFHLDLGFMYTVCCEPFTFVFAEFDAMPDWRLYIFL